MPSKRHRSNKASAPSNEEAPEISDPSEITCEKKAFPHRFMVTQSAKTEFACSCVDHESSVTDSKGELEAEFNLNAGEVETPHDRVNETSVETEVPSSPTLPPSDSDRSRNSSPLHAMSCFAEKHDDIDAEDLIEEPEQPSKSIATHTLSQVLLNTRSIHDSIAGKFKDLYGTRASLPPPQDAEYCVDVLKNTSTALDVLHGGRAFLSSLSSLRGLPKISSTALAWGCTDAAWSALLVAILHASDIIKRRSSTWGERVEDFSSMATFRADLLASALVALAQGQPELAMEFQKLSHADDVQTWLECKGKLDAWFRLGSATDAPANLVKRTISSEFDDEEGSDRAKKKVFFLRFCRSRFMLYELPGNMAADPSASL